MKKILAGIISSLMAVCLLIVAGCSCGGTNWKKEDVTLKDWGDVVSNGGFVAETKNYVYFINGIGASGEENEFGMPVKGTLMAAKKQDVKDGKSGEEVEKCVVVPKLFTASDYKAGLFIDGDYVYYGTPNVNRNAAGTVDTNALSFMKTKLDGTDSTTFFTVSALSSQYRFVKLNDVVYIVCYDATAKEIISFNTSTKAKTVVAKTNDTLSEATTDATTGATTYGETLDTVSFIDDKNADKIAVIFTTKIFTAQYVEGGAGERATASYNKVYTYTAGDAEAKLVLDGKTADCKYQVSFIKNGYVFYTATKSISLSSAITYGISVADIKENKAPSVIKNVDRAVETSDVKSLTEVYYYDSNKTAIRLTTLIDTDEIKTESYEKTLATVSTVSTLLYVEGDYAYYFNNDGKLARIRVFNLRTDTKENEYKDNNEQVISNDSASTAWFAPKIVDGVMYYCDASTIGNSYVKFVALIDGNIDLAEENGEYTACNFINQQFICKRAKADETAYVKAYIENISTELKDGKVVLDVEKDGVKSMAVINKARELYNALDKEQKKNVEEETLLTLEKYEEAVKLSVAFDPLNGFDRLVDAQKELLVTQYSAATAALNNLIASKYETETVRGFVVENYNYYYQCAKAYFDKKPV